MLVRSLDDLHDTWEVVAAVRDFLEQTFTNARTGIDAQQERGKKFSSWAFERPDNEPVPEAAAPIPADLEERAARKEW